jgi:sulfate transport system ATP-binding protein
MEFLGQVNVFHGRVQEGKARVGNIAWDVPGAAWGSDGPAVVYMRPHELDLKLSQNGVPSLPAIVKRINPAGAIAKVTVRTEEGAEVLVDLGYEAFRELHLKLDDRVFIYPKNARVFAPEYMI